MIDPERDTPSVPDESGACGGVPLAEEVFLESVPVAVVGTAAAGPTHSRRPGLPGPGIWESLAWMAGVHVVQTAALFIAGAILAGASLSAMNDRALDDLLRDLSEPNTAMSAAGGFLSENLLYLAAATQAATLVYALAAIRLRFGRAGLERLGWQPPAGGHWLLVVLMVIPLQFLCGRLHEVLADVMRDSGRQYAEAMEDLARAPLPLLVLLIAVGPAIAEELLFRGLIGRGLVARLGLVRGIVLTSILFGIVHVNPGQALAVIPMGIAMHFVYLTTRSMWAPVTLHLLFNAVAAVVLKFGLDSTVASIPTHVLTASAATVTAIGLLLWQTRVQYQLRDGTIWNPGYVSTEVPPADIGAVRVRQDPRLLLLAGSTINSLGFVAVLWRLAAAW
jgi:membrane protease YdiL (CAAX protease family)